MANDSLSTIHAGGPFADGYDAEDRFMRFKRRGVTEDSLLTRSSIGNISNVNRNGTNTARGYNTSHGLTSETGGVTQTYDNVGRQSPGGPVANNVGRQSPGGPVANNVGRQSAGGMVANIVRRQSAGGLRVNRIIAELRDRGAFCSRRRPTREFVLGAQPPEDWRRTFRGASPDGTQQLDNLRPFNAISFRKLPNYSGSKFPAGATAGIQGLNENGYVGGNRIWKKITRSGSVVEHRVYIHAGPNLIAEYNAGVAASTPVQEYVYAGEIDSLVLIRRSDATKYGVTRNRQWSITALHDMANGNVVERYAYEMTGKRTIYAANGTTVRTTSSFGNHFGYTNRWHDEESGLMYFRARYFNPLTGEFLSRDPMEFVDGMSLYRGYFAICSKDPSGKRQDKKPKEAEWTDDKVKPENFTPFAGKNLDPPKITVFYEETFCNIEVLDWAQSGATGASTKAGIPVPFFPGIDLGGGVGVKFDYKVVIGKPKTVKKPGWHCLLKCVDGREVLRPVTRQEVTINIYRNWEAEWNVAGVSEASKRILVHAHTMTLATVWDDQCQCNRPEGEWDLVETFHPDGPKPPVLPRKPTR